MFRYLLQPLLQLLRFEQAHRLVVLLLRVIGLIPGGRWLLGRCYAVEHPSLEREVFGVKFRNPIGVAAGIDRNGEICNELGAMGFGFVEVGTLTPHGQSGNPTPRVFRSDDERSIRHRVGHANRGLQSAIRHLRHGHPGVVVGCNLACNASTPAEEAPKDVLKLFRNLYQYVDYFTVNVSGDDVQNEQLTHSEAYIRALLEPLFDFRRGQNQYRPILLKISPDLTDEEVDRITDILIATPLDGIVATNGSFHDTVRLSAQRKAGRVSGAPVTERSIAIVRRIHERSGGTYPIIGSGGMMGPEEVQAMLAAGADLVQLCTGLIYQGPKLLTRVCESLLPQPEEAQPEEAQPVENQAQEPTAEAYPSENQSQTSTEEAAS
ncbi:MAG: quinone-dependent dihydroorotate dehydrogenase [Alistipes sp.]|nr:quinone-dependent dihydroorotate dehydrogenase [Alistipes sp.]